MPSRKQYMLHPHLIPYNDHDRVSSNNSTHLDNSFVTPSDSASNNHLDFIENGGVAYVNKSHISDVNYNYIKETKNSSRNYNVVKESNSSNMSYNTNSRHNSKNNNNTIGSVNHVYVNRDTKGSSVNGYASHAVVGRDSIVYVKEPLTLTTSSSSTTGRHGSTYVINAGDDNASSVTSVGSSVAPRFHLVRKSSVYAPRVEAPPPEELKVDVYNVGVIVETKMSGGTFDPEKFKLEAVAPTGRVVKVSGDGHYAAKFNKDEIGTWNISLFYDGRYLDGCPIDVCDPSQVKVKELQGGHVGRQNIFYVDCTRAGTGEVGVDISQEGAPVVSHVTHTSTKGYYKVSWVPYHVGAYEVNVHFNRAEVREADFHTFSPEDRQRQVMFDTKVEPRHGFVDVKASCDWEVDYLTGGPFKVHATDVTDVSVYGMEDGTVCAHPTLIADCTKVGDGVIEAEVHHLGNRYPCKVRRDARPLIYKVSFRPRGPGVYRVNIFYDSKPVKGSPFIQEIEELSKPTAHGDGLYRAMVGQGASFTVDPRGFPGQVSVSVSGPTRSVGSTLEPQSDHTVKVTYIPGERGPHVVHVRLDGEDVEASPYTPLVVDPLHVRDVTSLDHKGVIPLRVHKERQLQFEVDQAGTGELTAEVRGPNGAIPVAIDAMRDGKQAVIFTPREEGKHYIHVNWGGYPLSKSPYMGFATHEPELVDMTDNVRLVPIELHTNRLNGHSVSVTNNSQQGIFRPIASNARSEVTVNRVDNHHTINRVDTNHFNRVDTDHFNHTINNAVTNKVINHSVNNKSTHINQQVLPSDPLTAFNGAASSTPRQAESPGEPQKIILSGKGLKEAEVDKATCFYLDATQASTGTPTAHLEDVQGTHVTVTSEMVRPQVYKCTYIPTRAGAYLLYVHWNNKALRGSPFKVDVRDTVRVNKVTTSSRTTNAVMGSDWEMRIDHREAGPGHLTVKVTDPLNEEMPARLEDNHDGTKSLKVTPRRAGRHIVVILYDGHHIMGSPYAIDIKDSQVVGQVKSWGEGLQNGVLGSFHGNFFVETSGAGGGDLKIKIMGPKGAFHVRMKKASQKDKVFQCFYDPEEPGVYTVSIQWSGVHVMGSPYAVLLAHTAGDLQRMQEEYASGGVIHSGSHVTDKSWRKVPGAGSRHSNGSQVSISKHGSFREYRTAAAGSDVLF